MLPETVRLADFSEVFGLAFGLGAVLYYLDLKTHLNATLDQLISMADDGIGQLPQTLAARKGAFMRLAGFLSETHEVISGQLALGSSACALGALLYSGFYPDEPMATEYALVILGVSFLSIAWSGLTFYYASWVLKLIGQYRLSRGMLRWAGTLFRRAAGRMGKGGAGPPED